MILGWFKDKVAVLPLEGPIMEGSGGLMTPFGSSSMGKVEDYLEKIKSKSKYKALILKINSPGGSPYKSKKMAELVKSLDIFKIALIEEKCTSGAYWIASSCDYVLADELSSIGGVGTISVRPDFSDLLDKLGINFDIQSEGKFKDEGMPFSKMSEEGKQHRKEMVKEINDVFKEQIKNRRDISEDSDVFEGQVFLGKEAERKKLVDELGNKDRALEIAKNALNEENVKIKDFSDEIKKGPSLLDVIR